MSYNSKYEGWEVEELIDSIGNKVDKVDGKQLSTEDFTTLLKQKLEGLNNYDDTAIQEAISGLQTQINTLVSGDASTAIESFNEIIAFLDGVEDTEDLASIIASIEQQIASKYTKPSGGIPKSDLESSVQTSLEKANTALQEHQSLEDYVKDTDLSAVAKSGSYNDLSNKPTIPDALADLTGDASHRTVTDTEKATWNAKSNFSGSYNDLTNKPTIPDISGKQDTLVSGTNIKTINGQSLLGEGDIVISGGSDGEFLPLTGGTIDGNLEVVGEFYADKIRTESFEDDFTGATLKFNSNGIKVTSATGSHDVALDITVLGDGTKFLSDDGTYKTIDTSGGSIPVVEVSGSATLQPNTLTIVTSLAPALQSFTLATPTDDSIYNEYMVQFDAISSLGEDSALPSFVFPSEIIWLEEPVFEKNYRYQISIVNNVGLIVGVPLE